MVLAKIVELLQIEDFGSKQIQFIGILHKPCLQRKFTQIPCFDPCERLSDEYETTFIVKMQRWEYVAVSNNVVLHEKANRLDILFHSVRPDERLSKKTGYLIQLVMREFSSN